MKLAELHFIGRQHPLYREIDRVCFLAKNLYNAALYTLRQHFFKSSKTLSYETLQKQFQTQKQPDYYALPTKVSQQVLMQLCQDFSSFFKAIQVYRQQPDKFQARPRIPNYKHKTKGRQLATYTIQALSKRKLKVGVIALSGTKITLPAQVTPKQVRLVPLRNAYKIEVVYEQEEKSLPLDKHKVAGIDMGLDNLAALSFNIPLKPILLNGKPLKAMNAYYNKKRAQLMSHLGDKGQSQRLTQLTHKRHHKVENYLHHTSRWLINHLVSHQIGTLVIGKNPLWKQEINLGKRTNQNFVNIPHARLIEQLEYKAKLVGIEVIVVEESYTSKCSFLDGEEIEKQEEYKGKRIKRGLFRSGQGILLNADINGSLNIIRKAFPKAAFADGIQGVVVHPVRFTPYKVAV